MTERIKNTTATWKKLRQIWKLGKCRTRTKLQFYTAVINSKLTYALETIHITKVQRRRLNTFQVKGLRQILKMQPTYINRDNTNRKVRRRANQIKVGSATTTPKVRKISKAVDNLQEQLLGHIIRAKDTDPLYKSTFKRGRLTPNLRKRKRVGRPRIHWTTGVMKRTWKKVKHVLTDGPAEKCKYREGSNRVHRDLLAGALLHAF